jgi:aminoglycoside/choline kinase family phosphotransferase
MDKGLRALGFSAPYIYGEDLEAGLLLIEDLGSEPFTDKNSPIPERYAEATRLLAQLHGQTLPQVLPVAGGIDHPIPPYDLEALLIEVELLLDWYVPHIIGTQLSGSARAEFVNLWTETLGEVLSTPASWTLRDYHSPNLIWLPEREGLQRVGMIDFQDAVLGSPAYDVASLLQDARVTVPPELELKLIGHYARERKTSRPSPAPTPSWRASAPPRSSASSPASTGAMASRITSSICRGSKPTSSATSPIRPWGNSRSGMKTICRGSFRMRMKPLPNPEPSPCPRPPRARRIKPSSSLQA